MPVAGKETRVTTVRLPRPVYDQAKCVIEHEKRGATTSISLNDFIVRAITAYLKLLKRRQIDTAFASMAEDADYQKEARLLAEEFEASDWEALRLSEEEEEQELTYASSAAR